MSEYADAHMRKDIQARFGFDPGPQKKPDHNGTVTKVPCPKCGKRFKAIGIADHLRDYHHMKDATQ